MSDNKKEVIHEEVDTHNVVEEEVLEEVIHEETHEDVVEDVIEDVVEEVENEVSNHNEVNWVRGPGGRWVRE